MELIKRNYPSEYPSLQLHSAYYDPRSPMHIKCHNKKGIKNQLNTDNLRILMRQSVKKGNSQ